MAVSLSFASVVAKDVTALSSFYAEVFGLSEVSSLASEHFRGLWIDDTVLGFSTGAAYELLNLPAPTTDDRGVRTFLTFECETPGTVDRYVNRAEAAGATITRAAGPTYYGAWQAVLLDPEGNAFRVNHLPIER